MPLYRVKLTSKRTYVVDAADPKVLLEATKGFIIESIDIVFDRTSSDFALPHNEVVFKETLTKYTEPKVKT